MTSSKRELQAELRRELEHVGFDVREADETARRQMQGDPAEEDNFNPPQHVVSVNRGWVVVRDFANQDLGLFETRDEAIATAESLAEASGARVIVHDASGREE